MGTANKLLTLIASFGFTAFLGIEQAMATDYAVCPAHLRPQIHPSNCGPRNEILANLYHGYNEQLVAQGLVSERQVIEIYAASGTEESAPSWSLTTVNAQGQACLLTGGDMSVVAQPNAVLEQVLQSGERVYFGGLSQISNGPAGALETRAIALVDTSEDGSGQTWAVLLATGQSSEACKLYEVTNLETSFDLPSELKGVAL